MSVVIFTTSCLVWRKYTTKTPSSVDKSVYFKLKKIVSIHQGEYFSKNLFASSFPIIILTKITNGEIIKKILLIILYRKNINYF